MKNSLKSYLLHIWFDEICEGHNRRMQRRIIKASKLYHKGGAWNQFFAMLIHNRTVKMCGCEIYPQASIDKGLYIPHAVGIVVGNTTIIGKNCTIFPNVVFGAKYSPNQQNPSGRRHAKVGDNCVIGANSTIIGNITIGNNVTVGAGATVTKNIPDNCVVVGHNIIKTR